MSKFCIQCGKKLGDNSKFCSNCGNKVDYTEPTTNTNNFQPQFSNDENTNNIPPSFSQNNTSTNIPPPFLGTNKAGNNVPPPPPPPSASNNNTVPREHNYNRPPNNQNNSGNFNGTNYNLNNTGGSNNSGYNSNNSRNNDFNNYSNNSRNNNSNYNPNVNQTKSNSTSSLVIIISVIAVLIVLFIGGFVFFKSGDIKGKFTSFISKYLPNSVLNNNNSQNNNNTTNNNNSQNNNSNNDINSDTTTPSKNNSSNNTLSDEMIKDYIALADSTALNLFKAASEAEQNGLQKQSFESIRPLLQNCYSDAIVDNQLKPFYESELGQWTYELGMAFPFYTKTYFNECTFTVTQRTDSIVQVNIIDNNPEPLVYSNYTLKRYDKIWKIENIEIITND